jgi:hypothetical protein
MFAIAEHPSKRSPGECESDQMLLKQFLNFPAVLGEGEVWICLEKVGKKNSPSVTLALLALGDQALRSSLRSESLRYREEHGKIPRETEIEAKNHFIGAPILISESPEIIGPEFAKKMLNRRNELHFSCDKVSGTTRTKSPSGLVLEPVPYIVYTGEHSHNMRYFRANFLDFPEAIAYKDLPCIARKFWSIPKSLREL